MKALGLILQIYSEYTGSQNVGTEVSTGQMPFLLP